MCSQNTINGRYPSRPFRCVSHVMVSTLPWVAISTQPSTQCHKWEWDICTQWRDIETIWKHTIRSLKKVGLSMHISVIHITPQICGDLLINIIFTWVCMFYMILKTMYIYGYWWYLFIYKSQPSMVSHQPSPQPSMVPSENVSPYIYIYIYIWEQLAGEHSSLEQILAWRCHLNLEGNTSFAVVSGATVMFVKGGPVISSTKLILSPWYHESRTWSQSITFIGHNGMGTGIGGYWLPFEYVFKLFLDFLVLSKIVLYHGITWQWYGAFRRWFLWVELKDT